MFGGDTTIKTWMVIKNVWKYTKNAIKSKGHIRYVDISNIKMCIFISHTFCESLVKICAINRKCRSFFGIFHTYSSVVQKKGLENKKNLAPLGSTRIIYLTFSKYSKFLYKLVLLISIYFYSDLKKLVLFF